MVGPVEAPDLHVMTYNIRRRMPRMIRRSKDLWANRRPLLQAILRAEQPTILAVQEALADQAAFIGKALGPAYERVGRGRNRTGDGERCPIFYDTRRLTLQGWSQRALSATPLLPGSRSWGNILPRMVVSADLIDNDTGIRFTVFNTHFDNVSRRSRTRSAVMINQLVMAAAQPAIVMGDLNAGPRSPAVRILTTGPLRDAWAVAQRRLTPLWATYSGYRRPRTGGKRIDWMLVTATVAVEAVGVNAVRMDGAAASDHEPVQARVRLIASTPAVGSLS